MLPCILIISRFQLWPHGPPSWWWHPAPESVSDPESHLFTLSRALPLQPLITFIPFCSRMWRAPSPMFPASMTDTPLPASSGMTFDLQPHPAGGVRVSSDVICLFSSTVKIVKAHNVQNARRSRFLLLVLQFSYSFSLSSVFIVCFASIELTITIDRLFI